jgi:hypothetical protein
MDYNNMDIENMDLAAERLETKKSKKSKKSKKADDKDLRHVTRRKIEDVLAFKRLREENGWMDDFELEFTEVY